MLIITFIRKYHRQIAKTQIFHALTHKKNQDSLASPIFIYFFHLPVI